MGGEIASTAILLSTLVLVGLGVGFVMLRLQGGEE
ncbi:MAG: PetM family cytochrome b6-f complex subunit 7 [Cyanobacteria bacterium P01_D01_bin.115]